MEEIKLNMENLTEEEREQLLKLVEKANKKESKVWKPECGDTYYMIFEGEIYEPFWGYRLPKVDDMRYSYGNCFKTREEAEFALERQKVIVELERFAKEHNDPTKEPILGLWYNRFDKRIVVLAYTENFASTIRFSTCDIAFKAIDTIGEDRLIKYYFGVKK